MTRFCKAVEIAILQSWLWLGKIVKNEIVCKNRQFAKAIVSSNDHQGGTEKREEGGERKEGKGYI